MITLVKILNEALNDVDKAVDFIYKKANIDAFLKKFNAGEKPYEKEIQSLQPVYFLKIHSDDLIRVASKKMKKAIETKPVKIYVGIMYRSNYYKPSHDVNYPGDLYASFSSDALRTIYNDDIDFLTPIQQRRIKTEITPQKIKASIAHELSHWVDDAWYNQITKASYKAGQANDASFMRMGHHSVDMTFFEINSQIHAIHQLKKMYSDNTWNSFTFDDLIYLIPSLNVIYYNLLSIEDGQKSLKYWKKKLLSRMAREGIAGKNMKSS